MKQEVPEWRCSSEFSKGGETSLERVGEAGWDAFRVSALRRIRVWPPGFRFRCGPHLHVQEPGSDVASPHCGCACGPGQVSLRLRGQVLRRRGRRHAPGGALYWQGLARPAAGP